MDSLKGIQMAEEMSKEQSATFSRVFMQMMDAVDVFQRTGRREQFMAVSDQIDAYKKEFDAKLEISLGDGKIC